MFGIGTWEMIILGLFCFVVPLIVIGVVLVVVLTNRKGSTPQPTNLISCPDCGRQISPAAASCPHCGRPINAG